MRADEISCGRELTCVRCQDGDPAWRETRRGSYDCEGIIRVGLAGEYSCGFTRKNTCAVTEELTLLKKIADTMELKK
jgi:hypothetical protein